MTNRNSFFHYNAPEPTDFANLPAGAFNGTREEWESLTPGFRREIVRTAQKGGAA